MSLGETVISVPGYLLCVEKEVAQGENIFLGWLLRSMEGKNLKD